jgi:branched-chain amino acid transport system permease protein
MINARLIAAARVSSLKSLWQRMTNTRLITAARVSSLQSLWRRFGWIGWVLVLLIAVSFPFLVDRPRFWLPNIGVKSLWLGIIAMSLVFLNRYVGLLSLAQVTIAGIASYGVGYVMVTLGLPFGAAIPAGLLAGTFAGFIIALIAARTKAIYFLMITLALGYVFFSWASQAIEVTNARRGLAPIVKPDLGFINLNEVTAFYFFALICAVICYLLCRYVAASSFGLTLQGIRDSPERMAALGYRVNRYRIAAITFAAFIASVGGVVLVFDRAQVDPDVASLGSTLDVLVVAIIGGILSLGGVFVGAIILTMLDNFAQDFTDRYMTLTGIVFILVLLFAPTGIAGIGKQVGQAVRRLRKNDFSESQSGASPEQEPEATQLTGDAITKGNQQ